MASKISTILYIVVFVSLNCQAVEKMTDVRNNFISTQLSSNNQDDIIHNQPFLSIDKEENRCSSGQNPGHSGCHPNRI